MTIPEAVSLVMLAGTYAKGGEIFVLDMGSPVKIDTLARNLIRLSGFKPDVDIKVEYTGLRPGEKLFEEKLMAEEGLTKTDNDLIHIGKPVAFEVEPFLKQLDALMEAAYKNKEDQIREMVEEVVTTYHPEKAGEEEELRKSREIQAVKTDEAAGGADSSGKEEKRETEVRGLTEWGHSAGTGHVAGKSPAAVTAYKA